MKGLIYCYFEDNYVLCTNLSTIHDNSNNEPRLLCLKSYSSDHV